MNTIAAHPEAPDAPVDKSRLSIDGLLVLIWNRKLLFLSVTVLVASLIIAWAFWATRIYTAEVKVMPRQNSAAGEGLQGSLGQLGGLAGLIGLNIGTSVHTQANIALLSSRALFQTFVKRNDLMPVLFSKKWNPTAHRWRANLKHVPTMEDAWDRFNRGIRVVDQNDKTQVVTLKIIWKDRHQAAAWANELVRLANENIRQRALNHAEASLRSLQQQLKTINTVELRESIYRLMEEQINLEVVAKSRPDYAFVVLDPAFVPDANKFSSPRRKLLVLAAFPFGLMMASLAVVGLRMLKDFFRRLRHLTAPPQ